jgi:hypothetical protein
MENLWEWAVTLLIDYGVTGEPDDPDADVRYLTECIERAVEWVLPEGVEWDQETGELSCDQPVTLPPHADYISGPWERDYENLRTFQFK